MSNTHSLTKYIVLLAFSLLAAINGYSWLMFDPAKDELDKFFAPNFSSFQLKLLSSWQPAMYMLCAPIATALLVRPNGLWLVMRLGIACEFAGAVIKFLACYSPHHVWALVLLHAGQILSATVSPIAIGSPAALAALWFPEHQRTRATGMAVLANNIGNGVAFLLIPALAERIGYRYVVLVELCCGALIFAVTFLCVPRDEESPFASRAARRDISAESPVDAVPLVGVHDRSPEPEALQEAQEPLWRQSLRLLKMPAPLALCIVYSWSSGGYVAWTSLFDDLLSRYARWTNEFIGVMTSAATLAYIVGGAASSTLADAYWHKHMKLMLIACCIGATASAVLLAISVPSPFAADDRILLDWGDVWLVAVTAFCGACNGAAAPLFYEYVAEISYPVPEGVSGNMMSYFENGGSLVLYQVVGNLVTPQQMNIAFAIGMAAVTLLLAFARGEYKRCAAEGRGGGDGAGDDLQLAYGSVVEEGSVYADCH